MTTTSTQKANVILSHWARIVSMIQSNKVQQAEDELIKLLKYFTEARAAIIADELDRLTKGK